MNKKIILFEEFEKAVMHKMLDKNNQISEILQEQYKRSQIIKRDFTGTGFFTDLEMAQDAPHVTESIEGGFGDVIASINGSSFDFGFVLFIVDGVMTCLEGYTWADEWPEVIYEYQLKHSDDLL